MTSHSDGSGALAESKRPRTLDDVIADSSPEVKEIKAVFDADYQARMHCCPHGVSLVGFTSGKHSQPYKVECSQCSVEELEAVDDGAES